MKFLRVILLLVSPLCAEVPKVFNGLLEKEIPVKAAIGMVVPPQEIEKYIAKVEAAARKDPQWFTEYAKTSKPGAPLPFHEKLGLIEEEYEEYLALWAKREFKTSSEIVLVLREASENNWVIIGSGDSSILSTLRYDSKKDVMLSPNGQLERIEDIKAESSSILGAWSGHEWRLEEETGLGKTKENFAIGRYVGKEYGLIVYRVQELSSGGSRLMDKSLVIRFPLGKAGHLKLPSAPAKR